MLIMMDMYMKMQITPEQYKEMVENDTITDALAQYNVKEDDCFFIPAGRIHAIGTGCFVAEIQQTSDVTYRIYDFKRKDKDGNYRQLHTKEAAECIDYNVQADYRQHYTPAKNQGVSMVQCPYFTTAVYDLDEPMTLDYSELDSFVILIGLKGKAKITDNEIRFDQIGEQLMPYQLSAGEKQILAILLTVLVEDNLPYVLFMDEPEISLHFEWQKQLIGLVLQLNPNIQIIMTTSMPIFAMILSFFILKEPITWKKALGVLMGCAGACIIILTSATAGNAKVGDERSFVKIGRAHV